ncbi:hypothetical protein CPB84DRAFT_1801795 [Gymnopilus junonius]|uniref:Uncharacterized protein n=1 Tax=Gymnopilus junonius TaxID=109634 RepID=A0A9P5N8E1_GYMJU|nr:hypothetical protein CPB84DRAFT_1801795 [Gymnopilus junonius]
MTFLEGSPHQLTLRICDDVPHGQPIYPCFTIFNSTFDDPKYNGGMMLNSNPQQVRFLNNWENGMNVTPQLNPQNTSQVLSVTVETAEGQEVSLSEQCLQILVYPSEILLNFRREDITWICLQFWLLAISFLAILNDSVPHLLSVLMTHTISAAWAVYATWRNPHFKEHFQEILADPGTPCSLDMFTSFWERRQSLEIVDAVLSCTALVLFFFLSWTLLKVYNEQSFKCVGAPEHVMRINKFFMAVLACLQMEAFVLPASMGLWIDVLRNTSIARISAHTGVYVALIITTVTLLIPWIIMGWYSIKREMKRLMVVFLAITFGITAGWAIMFYSIVYRWTFLQFPYIGCFTVSSFILLISSMVLGVVCRLNFDKGLAQYLHAEETLASLNFAPDAFDHKAENRTSTASSKKFRESKSGDAGDYPDSPTMYFVQTLPAAEQALPLPHNASYETQPEQLPRQQHLRPFQLTRDPEKDKSFFKPF